jgi:hypothetical protein
MNVAPSFTVALAMLAPLVLPGLAAAQEPSPPLGARAAAPIEGKEQHVEPAPRDVVADFHVESTVLGFEQGVGPAVGREVSYDGKQYTVAAVAVANGAPCFSGGSHFTIAPAGGRLVIGLKPTHSDQVNVASLR